MKYLFLITAILLVLFGLALHFTEPEKQTEVPVIYWVIDPAPARPEQIALYHKWLVRNGHGKSYTLKTISELNDFRRRKWTPEIKSAIRDGNTDGAKVFAESTTEADLPITVVVPGVEMRVDAAGNDLNKKLVQGVSGVAGDVIEAYGGGQQLQYMAAAGMLADVTESASLYGFEPKRTYKTLQPALFYDGRQYAFPRNVAQTMYWVNKETFAKYHQPVPPSRWTVDEFEERGKAFIKAANPSGGRVTTFFADRALTVELRRSMGLSMFNETMTRCTLDDSRNVRLLNLIYKWTYEDHILPSAADRASFATEGGWGGQSFQLFKKGRFGMFASGRWALMLFRKFGDLKMTVVEPPYEEMPNTVFSGGQSTVYRRSRHRKYAELFLAYMASEDYNMQIVRSGDALPPNPKYTHSDLYRHPSGYPNERECHEPWARAATEISIVQSFSPFVLPIVALRYDKMAEEAVMNKTLSSEAACAQAAMRINADIERSLKESSELKKKYEELIMLQKKIDEYRKSGKKVPLDWIKNPFHRIWYVKKGWGEGITSTTKRP